MGVSRSAKHEPTVSLARTRSSTVDADLPRVRTPDSIVLSQSQTPGSHPAGPIYVSSRTDSFLEGEGGTIALCP